MWRWNALGTMPSEWETEQAQSVDNNGLHCPWTSKLDDAGCIKIFLQENKRMMGFRTPLVSSEKQKQS